jgi:hypothetical protein
LRGRHDAESGYDAVVHGSLDPNVLHSRYVVLHRLERLFCKRWPDALMQHDDGLCGRHDAEPGHDTDMFAAANKHNLPRLYL